jgi:hypothetical protein
MMLVTSKFFLSLCNALSDRRHSVASLLLICHSTFSPFFLFKRVWQSRCHAPHHPPFFTIFSKSFRSRLTRIHREHVRRALSKSLGPNNIYIWTNTSVGRWNTDGSFSGDTCSSTRDQLLQIKRRERYVSKGTYSSMRLRTTGGRLTLGP